MSQCAEDRTLLEDDTLTDEVILNTLTFILSYAPSGNLIEIASSHGVLPLIGEAKRRGLIDHGRCNGEKLKDEMVRQAMYRLRIYSVLHDLSVLFKECGIPFLVLKGVSLEALYYPPGIPRGQGDIDLLLDPATFDKAVDTLLTHPELAEGSKTRIVSIGSHAHTVLYKGISVDLHRTLLEDRYPSLELWDTLYEKRQAITGGWGSAATLSNQDSFLFLVAHGAKHQWCRLKWVMDLVWFLAAIPEDEVTPLIQSLERYGLKRSGSVALYTIVPFLPTELSRRVLSQVESTSLIRFVASSYQRDLLRKRAGWAAKAQNIIRTVATSGSFKSGFIYLYGVFKGVLRLKKAR